MKLSLSEFKKVIKDYRLKFSDKESETLFKRFDRDASGEIDYDEFLRTCVVLVATSTVGIGKDERVQKGIRHEGLCQARSGQGRRGDSRRH